VDPRVVSQAVSVPYEALRGIERVQAYPGVDEYSALAVVEAAMVLEEVEALLWVSANPLEYTRGVFDGFIICLVGVQFSPPYLALNRVDEVHASKALTTSGAVCEPFGVCFAPVLFVEKHPLVLSFNPPELPPDRALLLA
jgi:hypothetical protein